jgi:hypothetical protein
MVGQIGIEYGHWKTPTRISLLWNVMETTTIPITIWNECVRVAHAPGRVVIAVLNAVTSANVNRMSLETRLTGN